MDFYTAAEILEEVMELADLDNSQMQALEVAIELLKERAGEEDDLR